MRFRRPFAVLAAAGLITAGPVAVAHSANAQEISGLTTRFVISGTGGDSTTGDASYLYSPDNAFFDGTASATGDSLSVTVRGLDGHVWRLVVAAPAGEVLTEGRTYSASGMDDNPGGAVFDLGVDSRACASSTTTFTVNDLYFVDGWIGKFHATFEHHCDSATAYSSGKIVLVSVPNPTVVESTVTVTSGKVTKSGGQVTLSGTVTCNIDISLQLSGFITQKVSRTQVATGGWSNPAVACGPTTTTWSAVGVPADGSVAFVPGRAEVSSWWGVFDPVYEEFATSDLSSPVVVQLRR